MTKKRVARSLLSLMLVFAMVFSLVPSTLQVQAAGEEVTGLVASANTNFSEELGWQVINPENSCQKEIAVRANEDIVLYFKDGSEHTVAAGELQIAYDEDGVVTVDDEGVTPDDCLDSGMRPANGDESDDDGLVALSFTAPGDYIIYQNDDIDNGVKVRVYGLMVYGGVEYKAATEEEEEHFSYNRDDNWLNNAGCRYPEVEDVKYFMYLGQDATEPVPVTADKLQVAKIVDEENIEPIVDAVQAVEGYPDGCVQATDKMEPGRYIVSYMDDVKAKINWSISIPWIEFYADKDLTEHIWSDYQYREETEAVTIYAKVNLNDMTSEAESITDIQCEVVTAFGDENEEYDGEVGYVRAKPFLIGEQSNSEYVSIGEITKDKEQIVSFPITLNVSEKPHFALAFWGQVWEDQGLEYINYLDVDLFTVGLHAKGEWDRDDDNAYSKERDFNWDESILLAMRDEDGKYSSLGEEDIENITVYKVEYEEEAGRKVERLVEEEDGLTWNEDDCFDFNVGETGEYRVTYKKDETESSVTIHAIFYGMDLFFGEEIKKANRYNDVAEKCDWNIRYMGEENEEYRTLYLRAGRNVESIDNLTIKTADSRVIWDDENDCFVSMEAIGEREYYANDKKLEPVYEQLPDSNDYKITIPDTFKGDFNLHVYCDFIRDDGETEEFGKTDHGDNGGYEYWDHWFRDDKTRVQHYTDDENDAELGFSGSFIPTLDYKKGGGFMWDDYPLDDPIYWVHADTVQGVIDKLAAVAKKGGKVTAWKFVEDEESTEEDAKKTYIQEEIIITDCKYIKVQIAPGKTEAGIAASKKPQTVVVPDGIEGISLDSCPETKLVSYHDTIVGVFGDGDLGTDYQSKINLGFIADSDVTYSVYGTIMKDTGEVDEDGNNIIDFEYKEAGDFTCGFADKKIDVAFGKATISSYYIDPVGITIAAKPSKLTYTEGETFDGAGMVISYTYANGLTGGKFTKDYTVGNTKPLTVNDKSVKITYDGFEAEVAITVNAKPTETPATTEAPATTETPATTEAPAPATTEAPAKVVPDVGTTVETTDKDAAYKVVDKGTESSEPEVVYTKPATSSANVKIPSTVTDANGVVYVVVAIEANAFKNDKKLTKVTIPATVETIGNNAFAGCKKLTSVTIGNNVTTIGQNAFANCTKLKKVTVTKEVTTIGKGAFSGCKSLKTITIKSTKIKKISKNAFKGLAKNATIKVPKKQKKAYTKLLKKAGFKGKIK